MKSRGCCTCFCSPLKTVSSLFIILSQSIVTFQYLRSNMILPVFLCLCVIPVVTSHLFYKKLPAFLLNILKFFGRGVIDISINDIVVYHLFFFYY